MLKFKHASLWLLCCAVAVAPWSQFNICYAQETLKTIQQLEVNMPTSPVSFISEHDREKFLTHLKKTKPGWPPNIFIPIGGILLAAPMGALFIKDGSGVVGSMLLVTCIAQLAVAIAMVYSSNDEYTINKRENITKQIKALESSKASQSPSLIEFVENMQKNLFKNYKAVSEFDWETKPYNRLMASYTKKVYYSDYTLAHMAVARQDKKMLRFIAESKGKLHTPDAHGHYPIDLAIVTGSVETFRTLNELTTKAWSGWRHRQKLQKFRDHIMNRLERMRVELQALRATVLNIVRDADKLRLNSLLEKNFRLVSPPFTTNFDKTVAAILKGESLDKALADIFAADKHPVKDPAYHHYDSEGNTLLHIAMLAKNFKAAAYLLRGNIFSLTQANKHGDTFFSLLEKYAINLYEMGDSQPWLLAKTKSDLEYEKKMRDFQVAMDMHSIHEDVEKCAQLLRAKKNAPAE